MPDGEMKKAREAALVSKTLSLEQTLEETKAEATEASLSQEAALTAVEDQEAADALEMLKGDAAAKFNELDEDASGHLEGKEISLLAQWVWQSFHPDEKINEDQCKKSEAMVLKKCDTSGDGSIDKEEFLVYYKQHSRMVHNFNTAKAKNVAKKRKENRPSKQEIMLASCGGLTSATLSSEAAEAEIMATEARDIAMSTNSEVITEEAEVVEEKRRIAELKDPKERKEAHAAMQLHDATVKAKRDLVEAQNNVSDATATLAYVQEASDATASSGLEGAMEAVRVAQNKANVLDAKLSVAKSEAKVSHAEAHLQNLRYKEAQAAQETAEADGNATAAAGAKAVAHQEKLAKLTGAVAKARDGEVKAIGSSVEVANERARATALPDGSFKESAIDLVTGQELQSNQGLLDATLAVKDAVNARQDAVASGVSLPRSKWLRMRKRVKSGAFAKALVKADSARHDAKASHSEVAAETAEFKIEEARVAALTCEKKRGAATKALKLRGAVISSKNAWARSKAVVSECAGTRVLAQQALDEALHGKRPNQVKHVAKANALLASEEAKLLQAEAEAAKADHARHEASMREAQAVVESLPPGDERDDSEMVVEHQAQLCTSTAKYAEAKFQAAATARTFAELQHEKAKLEEMLEGPEKEAKKKELAVNSANVEKEASVHSDSAARAHELAVIARLKHIIMEFGGEAGDTTMSPVVPVVNI